MNTTYNSIWNESLGAYVAAAESVSSAGRRASSSRRARRSPLRTPSSPMALEQRIVFDGAMLATAVEVQVDSPSEVENPASGEALDADSDALLEDDFGADAPADTPEEAASAEPGLTSAAPVQEDDPSEGLGGDSAALSETSQEESTDDGVADDGDDALASTLPMEDAPTDEVVATADTEESVLMEAEAGLPREIVFIDAVATDLGGFVQAEGSEVIYLDGNSDGVEQIRLALEGRTDVSAIHIVSHGVEGRLMLGNTVLDADSMTNRYADSLVQIGSSLTEDADILIYGCNFSEGEVGLTAANLLAQYTGADIAASDDTTGHESLGGDWDLEVQVGEVTASALTPTAWEGKLDLVIENVGTVGDLALANAIMGAGVTVTSATYSGGADQAGVFTTGSGLTFGSNVLEFTEGAIFTSNTNTSSVGGTNNSTGLSANAPDGIDGDTDFAALSPYGSFDASFIEIHFTPDVYPGSVAGDTGRMTASIVFGSEEYNEYVYGRVNDSVGLWVNGTNVAVVPNGQAIGIDTINDAGTFNPGNGNVAYDPNPDHTSGSFESANPNLYINNSDGAYVTQMDGFTVTLSLTFDVIVGQDNVIKVGIADTGDSSLDSWLFVKAASMQTAFVAENDSITTPTNTPLTVDVTANDVDQGGGTLSIVAINGTTVSPGSVVTLDSGITLTMGAGGQITAEGDGVNLVSDTFTYTVSNGSGQTTNATVSVEMTAPVNHAPVADNDSFTVAEDGSVSIDVLDNDSDLNGDTLTVTQVDGQAITEGGAAVAVTNGSVALVAGELVFTPDSNYNGPAAFDYTVSDGTVTATANVSGTVTAVNDDPVPNDPTDPAFDPATGNYSVSTPEDTAVNGQVVATDEEGDTLTYSKGSDPTNGSVTVNGDGTWTYTPDADYNGSDSFTVSVSDGNGGTTTSTVNVGVTPVNDAPVASGDMFTVAEGASVSIDVLDNDSDVDGDALTITQVDGQAITEGGAAVAVTNGSVTLVGGELVFAPTGDYNGPASFDYTVSDGFLTTTATVSGTVTAVNDDPVANDPTDPTFDPVTGNYNVSTAEDTPVNGQVVATDVDGDPLTYGLDSGPANGSVTVNGDGTWTYTPDADFNGSDSFTVSVSDGNGGSTTSTVNIDVTAVNDDPVANDPTDPTFDPVTGGYNVSTPEDTPVNGQVVASDVDGDPLTYSLDSGPANGSVTVNGDGTWSYTPDADFNGPDSFTVSVSDGSGGSTTSTVNIDVTPTNDDPVANDPTDPTFDPVTGGYNVSTAEDTPVSGQVVATDVEGSPLTYSLDSGPANGSVTVNGDGTWTYTPDADYNGPDSFTVIVSDGNGGTTTSTVNIGVTAVNDGPVANADSFTVAEDGQLAIDVLDNDTDVDGDSLTITQVNGKAITEGGAAVSVANGSVALVNGALVFKPAPDYNGGITFSYTVSDGVASSTATVQGRVTPVADPQPTPPAASTPPAVAPSPAPVVDRAPVANREPAAHTGHTSSLGTINNQGTELFVSEAVGSTQFEASMLTAGAISGQTDRVLIAEGMAQLPDNMLLVNTGTSDLVPDLALKSLDSFGSFVPAVYVQHAVRYEALTSDHGLFVQKVVQATQLESRLNDLRITAQSRQMDAFDHIPGDSFGEMAFQADSSAEAPEARQAPSKLEELPLPEPEDAGDPSGESTEAEGSDAASTVVELRPAAAKGFRAQLQAFEQARKTSALSGVRRYG